MMRRGFLSRREGLGACALVALERQRLFGAPDSSVLERVLEPTGTPRMNRPCSVTVTPSKASVDGSAWL